MIIHTFHKRSPLHFTSLHFTSLHITSLHFTSLHFTPLHFTSHHFTTLYFISLHSPFFTSVHLWKFRHHTSKNIHFSSLIITLLSLFTKICALQGKVASALQAVGATVRLSYLHSSIYRYLFFVY